MKFMPFIFMFSLLFLTACQESSSKKSSSASCSGNNYYNQGCPGNPFTTGGATGNSFCTQSPQYNYGTPGCPGFCSNFPTHISCSATTGGATSGTTGGTGSTSCQSSAYNYYCVSGCPGYNPSSYICQNPNSGSSGLPADPLWAELYPKGTPTGTCSTPTTPSGLGFTPYDTRIATLTLAGGKVYDPSSGEPLFTTSDILTTATNARTFFETDSVLKVRFKARTQPNSARSTNTCAGRVSGQSSQPGYTKLMFSVELVGIKADGSTGRDPVGVYEIGVNSCQPSPGRDLTSLVSKYPGGVYLRIYDVYSNTNCSWTDASGRNIGFYNCNSWKLVRAAECWSIDIEVAADGTKTF